MELSEKWLHEWINPGVDAEELASQLTMAGLEVDSLRKASPALDNVVVAEVISCEKHPNADKLNLCQVDDGEQTFQVICGAPNVRQGLKVVFARIGARLPGIKIKKAKLRGVESHGMICSEAELELSEDHDGIMELPVDAPTGVAIVDYLGLDDHIIEIELTPNRGDCLSIAGVAREISAINDMSLANEPVEAVEAKINDTFTVELQAPDYCSRYVGRVIRGIDPQAVTPLWMQEKLRRCGLRPISPVVDVTNYVMMELGQPMHGFDFDKLEGGIVVRQAKAGEKITLLDQSEVECRDDTLVIADHNKALAMAGIMGGLDSSVQGETTNILFEAAFFSPVQIAGKARSYGMHTDSSHRFERGVDPELQFKAMERATALLLEIAGGQPGPVFSATTEANHPVAPTVNVRYDRVIRMLGIDVDREEMGNIFRRLNMSLADTTEGWSLTPPSYRFDINIEEDLVEEVGRLVGYNNIPGTQEAAHVHMKSYSETEVALSRFNDTLIARGYYEAVTYSFVSPELQKILDPQQSTLSLANPISADMSEMRTSLLPGLLQALKRNLSRQQSQVKLFESGLCFIPGESGLAQESHIAAVISGSAFGENLYASKQGFDFYDIKGDLESLLEWGNAPISFERADNEILHPGQSANVLANGEIIGFVGGLHPGVLKSLGLTQPVFVFHLKLQPLHTAALPSFREISKYPSIRRDVALIVEQSVEVQTLLDTVNSLDCEILQEVFVFDVYTPTEVRNSRKSVALGLILQDFSRTLVDSDVDAVIADVLSRLEQQHNAVLRES